MRILFIYEYGPRPDESMMQELIDALHLRLPGLRSKYFYGFLKRYIAGGTQPLRLLNYAYMYAALPFVMLAFRPHHVFVRTTPPGIQVWAAFLGKLFAVPVSCWLMDYHPEIEARACERRGWNAVARLLRKMDAAALRSFRSIVVLDEAMKNLVEARAPGVPLLVHSTWNKDFNVPQASAEMPRPADTTLNLVYAGNLGMSHSLRGLEALLRELKKRRSVTLLGIGLSAPGEARLAHLAGVLDIPLSILKRVPFSELGALFETRRIHLGIVLMAEESAGCLSPSKFSAYLSNNLPLLYIGPGGTNSEVICSRYHAGFALSDRIAGAELTSVADLLADPESWARAKVNVRAAAEFFANQNQDTLADELLPFFAQGDSRPVCVAARY